MTHYPPDLTEKQWQVTPKGAERTKKSPKAHTKTDTSSQEKLFGEIQNSFLISPISLLDRYKSMYD